MKKFYGKKFVATALAAIIAVSSISATVFADFPYPSNLSYDEFDSANHG